MVSKSDTNAAPSEVRAVQVHIKALLRERRWTYATLAERIGVSEVSVKRWLTASDLSLARIHRIATALDTTGFAVMLAAARGREESFVLDEATEHYLAAHPVDHAVWDSLQRGLDADDVRQHYGLDARDWGRTLRRLEAHTLLEVHPGDTVRRTRHGIHTWRRGGPLAQASLAWRTRRLARWLAEEGDAVVQSADRRMSAASYTVAVDELRELAARWRDRAWRDEHTLPPSAQHGVAWTLVLAPTAIYAPVRDGGPEVVTWNPGPG